MTKDRELDDAFGRIAGALRAAGLRVSREEAVPAPAIRWSGSDGRCLLVTDPSRNVDELAGFRPTGRTVPASRTLCFFGRERRVASNPVGGRDAAWLPVLAIEDGVVFVRPPLEPGDQDPDHALRERILAVLAALAGSGPDAPATPERIAAAGRELGGMDGELDRGIFRVTTGRTAPEALPAVALPREAQAVLWTTLGGAKTDYALFPAPRLH